MMVTLLLLALLAGDPPDSASAPPLTPGSSASHSTSEQIEQIRQKLEQARIQHEPIQREAIRINELAGRIRSEADARKLVDSVAEVLTNHRHLFWAAQGIRRRVAHAEYETVSDPVRLIPEQHIVDIWNEYVREIDAPEETLITAAELHSFRNANYQTTSRYAWRNDLSQSIWTMPNIYAVEADGQLAAGCRALESLKIIHEMHERFINVQAARRRVQMEAEAADDLKQPPPEPGSTPKPHLAIGWFHAGVTEDPIGAAVYRYRQEHGSRAYDRLIRRLFDELFPAE